MFSQNQLFLNSNSNSNRMFLIKIISFSFIFFQDIPGFEASDIYQVASKKRFKLNKD